MLNFTRWLRRWLSPASVAEQPQYETAKPAQASASEQVDDTTEQIEMLWRLNARFLWADEQTRRRIETRGVNLTRPDFYSESPTIADIRGSFEYGDAGQQLPVFGDAAVFDAQEMSGLARTLAPHLESFNPPEDGDPSGTGFYWNNGQFGQSDAAALYALLVARQPETLIEIGSGHSTRVASQAFAHLGKGRIICIDPEPRASVALLPRVEFIRRPIQSVPLAEISSWLVTGDVVFYDGSHTVKSGSDAVYFYLRLLPYLPSGTLVHAHDVSLPYASPIENLTVRRMNWGEQYLLMAHLHNRARYRVLLAIAFLKMQCPDALQALMGGKQAIGGGSLWYEIV
jgi:predicted O-methyltransferase YrrM